MKLATIDNNSRDGQLVVVNKRLTHYSLAPKHLPTLQYAVDNWAEGSMELKQIFDALENDQKNALPLNKSNLMAPLPRAYQWLDGSAYLNHVRLVRQARGADMPPEFLHDPLMYQGGSDTMLSYNRNIEVTSEDYGIDLEAEVCIITDDTPMACPLEEAGGHIILLGILNDVSLRNLIPAELSKGFGFMQSKPPTAFSAVFVTPDELGKYWHDYKIHLPLRTWINDQWFGHPNCGIDMQFNFSQLTAHACKTRPLGAGTIIGSGTISNVDANQGFCCLAETRMIEIINEGKAKTPFLKFGDRIKIDMFDDQGISIFGSIEQTVRQVCLLN